MSQGKVKEECLNCADGLELEEKNPTVLNLEKKKKKNDAR